MLLSRRLDDQRYDDILAQAKGRLPWLCPVWTDHNAHDPGITLLELMAWYKEMQQYQMDQLTPELQKGLLALAGVHPMKEQSARCLVQPETDGTGRRALSRLVSPRGVSFELAEEIPASRPCLERIEVQSGEQTLDITDMAQSGPAFCPFAFGRFSRSELVLTCSHLERETLRIWFDVPAPKGTGRSAPDEGTPPPRTLVWEAEGHGPVTVLRDETWSLSWSGCVSLALPKERGQTLRLRLRQEEGGCEEQVRLRGIQIGSYTAVQQESRAKSRRFTLARAPEQTVMLTTEFEIQAQQSVFVRTEQGWMQSTDCRSELRGEGRAVTVNASECAEDGEENLLVVSMDPACAQELLFDAKGRPGETFRLDLGEQKILTQHLQTMCMTLCEDGQVRPAPWRYVEDLSSAGPGDRVFTYDPDRRCLVFGDGAQGAAVCGGRGSVMVSELVVSLCEAGNLPADAGLCFAGERTPVRNTDAYGGRERESLEQARGRLIQSLSKTARCVSAADYEDCAKATPGFRVAAAKALPGYDPAAPHQKRSAMVTLAVLPAGESDYPVADERFLAAVERQLDRHRTICIRTAVVPVRYAPVALQVELSGPADLSAEAIETALRGYFAPSEDAIGAAVERERVMAFLQKQPGVLRVERLDLRGLDQNSYRTAAGDLQLPPDALAQLKECRVIRA